MGNFLSFEDRNELKEAIIEAALSKREKSEIRSKKDAAEIAAGLGAVGSAGYGYGALRSHRNVKRHRGDLDTAIKNLQSAGFNHKLNRGALFQRVRDSTHNLNKAKLARRYRVGSAAILAGMGGAGLYGHYKNKNKLERSK